MSKESMDIVSRAKAALRPLRSRTGRENVAYEWARVWRGEPALPPGPLARLLVICHGNICRSPFAAALLQDLCPDASVRSAGLVASGGDPAQPGAQRVACEWGIDLGEHRSTKMEAELCDWADLIIGMEGHHVAAVARAWPAARPKTFIVGDFLPERPHTIEDPWGEPDEVFRANFTRLADATRRLADRIRGT